ncbi:MAG: lysophospholipid acyltransferase family protein [Gemmatimonadota bacterium]|nr:lysophospholipid acyltransferase family protein [Gemmatimonadota bacterium]
MSDREEGRRGEARTYRGEYSGRLTNLLWPLSTWVLANLIAGPIVIVFFFLLNRTRVYGRSRVPRERNTLLLSNHQSMIDSFAVGYSAFYPVSWLRPFLIPWNPAAEENFFKNRFFSWLFHQFKCIPVRPGRRDIKAIHRSVRALRDGTMILFPEGTRSRDGAIGRGRAGAGVVILGTQPFVVPVTIDGMDDVLPVGARFPRLGRRISVYFGRPMRFEEYADHEPSRETAQEIVDRVMERIRFQRRVCRRIEGRGQGPGLDTGASR